MLNRVTNIFHDSTAAGTPANRPWKVDRNPSVRLIWLFLILLFPLIAVAARHVHLQGALSETLTNRFDQTEESYEAIPSRDGSILASDGRILAYDVERFDILVHYRWLEEPADKRWLRGQALSRLGRKDRRDKTRIDAEKRNVLARRREMWERLAKLRETSLEQLATEQMRIQLRVEKMIANVERRQRRADTQQSFGKKSVDSGAAWWQTVWQTVVTTLTTPPLRIAPDPLIVKEELAYHPLLANVPQRVAFEIAAHPELYPGLRIQASTQRTYPEKSLAAHIVGLRSLIPDIELERRANRFGQGDPLNYRRGDRIGKTGVERAYDRHLRGLPGRRKIVKKKGEVIRTDIVRRPRIGRDVVLTLDLPLQQQMEQLLDRALAESAGGNVAGDREPKGGCLIALDVHTGAIVAAVASPRFDLDLMTRPDSETLQRMREDPRRPFFPRATQMTLPPGSVFKTLTAVALLESGKIDPDESIYCRGYLNHPSRFRCYIYRHYGRGHGDINLSDALCRSCNVYFFTAADTLGPKPIVDWAGRFGFGQPTGIDLPGERGGNLPSPNREVARAGRNDRREVRSRKPGWYPGDTRQLAIGQSRLTVTPLQIARLMAAIANGGYLVTPHVVRDAGPTSLETGSSDLSTNRERHRIRGLSQATLERVREGLLKAVAHPRGTGYKRVRLKEIAIAGKTGTAEVGGGKRDHAWFAGYVPADRPRIAFAVVLEHSGSGGRVAGPVARQMVQAMLDHGLLQPTQQVTLNAE